MNKRFSWKKKIRESYIEEHTAESKQTTVLP